MKKRLNQKESFFFTIIDKIYSSLNNELGCFVSTNPLIFLTWLFIYGWSGYSIFIILNSKVPAFGAFLGIVIGFYPSSELSIGAHYGEYLSYISIPIILVIIQTFFSLKIRLCIGIAACSVPWIFILISLKNRTDTTPDLHRSVSRTNMNNFEKLLTRGEDIDVEDEFGKTALHLAIETKHYGMAEKLIEKNTNVNAINKRGITPLHLAAEAGNLNLTQLLIDKNAKVNVKDSFGKTPLMKASSEGNDEIVELLLLNGADVNAIDRYQSTALTLSVAWGHIETAKLLIKNGADVNVRNDRGETPLHDILGSIKSDTIIKEMAKLLIDSSADVAAVTENGEAVLHCLCKNDFEEIIQVVLNKGVSVDVRNKNGETPLHVLATYNNSKSAKLLITKGSDVNAQDNVGWTPLHRAVMRNSEELFNILIQHGADVNIGDNEGNTPLHIASESGHNELYEILKEKGADENARNKLGYTPYNLGKKIHREKITINDVLYWVTVVFFSILTVIFVHIAVTPDFEGESLWFFYILAIICGVAPLHAALGFLARKFPKIERISMKLRPILESGDFGCLLVMIFIGGFIIYIVIWELMN